EICEFVKSSLRHLHTRVVLLAGALEPVDEAEAARVHADGVLKKPLEASAVLAMVKPLLDAATAARQTQPAVEPEADSKQADPLASTNGRAAPDPELIRAAVTIALDAALPNLIEEIARKVLMALDTKTE